MNMNRRWKVSIALRVEGCDRGILVPICTRHDCGVSARIFRRADVEAKIEAAFRSAEGSCREILLQRLASPLVGSTLRRDAPYRRALEHHIARLSRNLPVYVGHPLDYDG